MCPHTDLILCLLLCLSLFLCLPVSRSVSISLYLPFSHCRTTDEITQKKLYYLKRWYGFHNASSASTTSGGLGGQAGGGGAQSCMNVEGEKEHFISDVVHRDHASIEKRSEGGAQSVLARLQSGSVRGPDKDVRKSHVRMPSRGEGYKPLRIKTRGGGVGCGHGDALVLAGGSAASGGCGGGGGGGTVSTVDTVESDTHLESVVAGTVGPGYAGPAGGGGVGGGGESVASHTGVQGAEGSKRGHRGTGAGKQPAVARKEQAVARDRNEGQGRTKTRKVILGV